MTSSEITNLQKLVISDEERQRLLALENEDFGTHLIRLNKLASERSSPNLTENERTRILSDVKERALVSFLDKDTYLDIDLHSFVRDEAKRAFPVPRQRDLELERAFWSIGFAPSRESGSVAFSIDCCDVCEKYFNSLGFFGSMLVFFRIYSRPPCCSLHHGYCLRIKSDDFK